MSDDNLKPHNGEEILFKPSLAGMEISRLMNLVNTKDTELQRLIAENETLTQMNFDMRAELNLSKQREANLREENERLKGEKV